MKSMNNSNVKTTLDFENDKVKALVASYDLHFFFEKYLKYTNYTQDDINTIYQEYDLKLSELQDKKKKHSKMYSYHIEDMAEKVANSGFMHALFYLDNSKQHANVSLQFVGKNIAYLEVWQEYYRTEVIKKRNRNYVIKIGCFLVFVLGIIKLYEILFQ